MRMLIAVLAASVVAACSLTLGPLPGDGQSCGGSGYSRSSSRCTPITVVITIGPTHRYNDSSDTMCYDFSPGAASVTTAGSYTFQNNTNSTITILGANQQPWATVTAGSTSTVLNFSSAGTYNFGVQGCQGVSGTPWYGAISVTTP